MILEQMMPFLLRSKPISIQYLKSRLMIRALKIHKCGLTLKICLNKSRTALYFKVVMTAMITRRHNIFCIVKTSRKLTLVTIKPLPKLFALDISNKGKKRLYDDPVSVKANIIPTKDQGKHDNIDNLSLFREATDLLHKHKNQR